MKILKLLNSKYLSILLITVLLGFNVKAEDKPVDIWNVDNNIEKTNSNKSENNKKSNDEKATNSNIYDLQSQKKN